VEEAGSADSLSHQPQGL